MSEHSCVDCAALPVARAGYNRFTHGNVEFRPNRPRAIDIRSEPQRCYSHLARSRRAELETQR